MIGRRKLPQGYLAWNAKWGAPAGKRLTRFVPWHLRTRGPFRRLLGPVAFQPNSETRACEYPWAFHAAKLQPGMCCMEVGGGLSGFQFALARSGMKVINVDPGESAAGKGWPVDQRSIERLNRSFGTDVELRNCTLAEAGVAPASVDRVFSISTIEHIPTSELPEVMRGIAEVLKPGGACVLTVDLFLNLKPFSKRETNHYGTNVDVRALIEASGLELESGERSELYGFDEFDTEPILAHLEDFYVGTYPAVAQAFVLRKPE